MEIIFHEKQEGSLCAQHCLNALLQGSYFTPVDLGTLAQQMDDEERLRMAENGEESEEYRKFLEQPSGNMDDSGYFSVQVITSALRVWGLELVPYTSAEQRAREACRCPSNMKAFICNYRDHWFTIRRLGNQWFNLNSLLSSPELISDTYLAMFLAQLQQEGYSIFVVFGELPDCVADEILRASPVIPRRKSSGSIQSTSKSKDESMDLANSPPALENGETDENELQKAITLSLMNDNESEDEEEQLKKAVAMSLECRSATPSAPSTPVLSQEDVRKKRLAFFQQNIEKNA